MHVSDNEQDTDIYPEGQYNLSLNCVNVLFVGLDIVMIPFRFPLSKTVLRCMEPNTGKKCLGRFLHVFLQAVEGTKRAVVK